MSAAFLCGVGWALGAGVLAWLQYGVAVALYALGVAGCVLPYPGHLLLLGGCALWAYTRGEPYPAWWVWAALGVLAVLGCFVDSLFSLLGAKRFGCSRAAFWGSALGFVVGVCFFFPLGIALGPFLGAFLGELVVARREMGPAAKVGVGAMVGALLGTGAKFVVAGAMLFIFYWLG